MCIFLMQIYFAFGIMREENAIIAMLAVQLHFVMYCQQNDTVTGKNVHVNCHLCSFPFRLLNLVNSDWWGSHICLNYQKLFPSAKF